MARPGSPATGHPATPSLFEFSGLRIDDAELQRLDLERLQLREREGEVGAFVDANVHLNAFAAVCRIRTESSYGTGSLVNGEPLGLPKYCILTNHHVLGSREEAASATCLFGYEAGLPSAKHQSVGLHPERGFVAHEEEGRLDFAVVACDEKAARAVELNDRKLCPLELDTQIGIVAGEPLTIPQHPRGGKKQVVHGLLGPITSCRLAYEADTEPGSSGAPVFNSAHQVVGVHYAGGASANYGCRISTILSYVASARGKLSFPLPPSLLVYDHEYVIKPERFELGELIAAGSHGKVYKATLDGEVVVAAKCSSWIEETLPKRNRGNPAQNRADRIKQKAEYNECQTSFDSECQALLHAQGHPNIVRMYGVVPRGKELDEETEIGKAALTGRARYLVTELAENSLFNFLHSPADVGVAVPTHVQVTQLASEITAGVLHLHDLGITHRDLSSKNIVLRRCETEAVSQPFGFVCAVTDLGVSKALGAVPEYHTKAPGAEIYCAPETLVEDARYTCAIDVFSIGVLVLEMLTREVPTPTRGFRQDQGGCLVTVPEAERRAGQLDKVPDSSPLKDIVLRCIDTDPTKRPSAAQLSQELDAIVVAHLRALPRWGTEGLREYTCAGLLATLDRIDHDPAVTNLVVTDKKVSDSGIGLMCRALRFKGSALLQLQISVQSVSDASLQYLAAALRNNTTMYSVVLVATEPQGDHSCSITTPVLKRLLGTTVTPKIIFGGHALNDETAKEVADDARVILMTPESTLPRGRCRDEDVRVLHVPDSVKAGDAWELPIKSPDGTYAYTIQIPPRLPALVQLNEGGQRYRLTRAPAGGGGASAKPHG
jgi:serine/threonine protein kinase